MGDGKMGRTEIKGKWINRNRDKAPPS